MEQRTAAAAVWSPAAVLGCLNNLFEFSRSHDTDGAAGSLCDHFQSLIRFVSMPLFDLRES